MKKKITIFAAAAFIILNLFLYYRYSQYINVWEVNPHVKVEGITLMMPEDEVRSILGKEEEYIQGFGGYSLSYRSKGISLTFLNDADTDFYKKVNKIEITDPRYSIFDIMVGQEYSEALPLLKKYGITHSREGYSGVWKRNIYVIIDKDGSGKIVKITVGIADRTASKRVY